MSPPPYCDFCGSTDVRWIYPCLDFSFMFVPMGDQWLACDICHLLIEANESEALALRSNNTLESQAAVHPR